MKTTKKAALVPSSLHHPIGEEEAKIRNKTQSLLQDYEYLVKDTEVKKKMLRRSKKKVSALTAQIRFLRRRYQDLVKNQPQKCSLPNCQTQTTALAVPSNLKHLSQRTSVIAACRTTKPDFRAENHLKEKGHRAKRTALLRSAVIDLNQTDVSTGGVECNVVSHGQRMEKSLEQHPFETVVAASHLNPPVNMNGGKEAIRTGKRKISWQDPVALWV